MSMQKFIDSFSRFFVGGLFIFSGLIKLNDPVGTQIKMEEYFEVFAQDFGSFFHVFISWSLEIGMVMIVLEITLGVAILLFYRMTLTTWVLLGLMIFFTFLTFYSAYFNKVTDCGCFGDAIKLTPWQSFWKDMILMVFVSHLVWYRRHYTPVLRTREGHAAVLGAVLLSLFLGIYAIRHLPFIDFRSYKVGNNIPQQMIPSEQPVIEYRFTRNGEEIRSTKYLTDSGYHYVSSRILNEDKIKPRIVDVKHAATENMQALRLLTRELDGKVETLILTASSEEDTEAFRHEHQLAVPYAFTDATVLKTMIRSNPGITLWKEGTVLGNWHERDAPASEEILDLLK